MMVKVQPNNEQLEIPIKKKNHGLLGAVSGMVVGIVLQPLEIIKMGLIINPMQFQRLEKANFVEQFYITTKYIHDTEGIKGFWRGIIPSLTRNTLASAIYFQYLEKFEHFTEKLDIEDNKANFINSAAARILSTLSINPFQVVAARFEVIGFNEYRNMRHAFVTIYQNEGISTFFKGSLASSLKDGPFAGIYYMIYKYCKSFLNSTTNWHYAEISLISGMIGGILATASTHPFEIIRARLQTNSVIKGNKNNQINGIIEGFQKMYINEGVKGFFRGLPPRLFKKPIVNALTFVTFETFYYRFTNKQW